ncbi:MAG: DUF5652 family protein [Candidatus Bathyarchaeia archaeon]
MAGDWLAPPIVIAYLIPIIAWSLFWEGLGLWFSARNGDRAWFALFLLVHLMGLPEIYYLHKRRCWPFAKPEANRSRPHWG